MVERLISEKTEQRILRNNKIIERFNEYMEAGSQRTEVYYRLADEFNLTPPTIIRVIKGSTMPRREEE